jgi:hypothetical protein
MWDQQNQEVHESTLEQQALNKKTAIIEEMQELRQANIKMPAKTRALITVDAERIQKLMNNNLEMFILSKVHQTNRWR